MDMLQTGWLVGQGVVLLCAKIALTMTVTVLVQHLALELLAGCGLLERSGDVPVKPLQTGEVGRYFKNMGLSFVTFSLQVVVSRHLEGAASHWRTDSPNVLELVAYSVVVLVLSDMSFYFGHRWLHSVERSHGLARTFSKWLHATPHHNSLPANKGMMAIDLMAVNPLETWFDVMPGYHASYALFSALASPNWYAAVFGFWVPIMVANLGHCGYDIPLPWMVTDVLGVNPVQVHAYHHKHVNKNFGMFFCWWDKVFETYKAVNFTKAK